jgi:hypothetical protein
VDELGSRPFPVGDFPLSGITMEVVGCSVGCWLSADLRHSR